MEILHSNIIGAGKPLVILHGFLGMSDNWKTLGNQYAENGYQVHMVDQRNHGRSFHSDQFDYPTLSHDLLNYLDSNGIEEICLIGHSMGGKTAMHFASSHPDRVKKLIVADIAPRRYPPHHQFIIKGLNSIPVSEISSRTEADKILSGRIGDVGIRQFLLKNLYRKSKSEFGFRFNLPVLAEKLEEIGAALSEDLHYNGDTLFLRGDRSDYIKETDAKLINDHFPNAEIITITGAGHWLHAEKPEEFFKHSITFFNR